VTHAVGDADTTPHKMVSFCTRLLLGVPTVQSVCSMYMGAQEGHDFIYVNKESERKKEAVVN